MNPRGGFAPARLAIFTLRLFRAASIRNRSVLLPALTALVGNDAARFRLRVRVMCGLNHPEVEQLYIYA